MNFLMAVLVFVKAMTGQEDSEEKMYLSRRIPTATPLPFSDCHVEAFGQASSLKPSLAPLGNYPEWWVKNVHCSQPLPTKKNLFWEKDCAKETLAAILLKNPLGAYNIVFPHKKNARLLFKDGLIKTNTIFAIQILCQDPLLAPLKKNILLQGKFSLSSYPIKKENCVVVVNHDQPSSLIEKVNYISGSGILHMTHMMISDILGNLPFNNITVLNLSYNLMKGLEGLGALPELEYLNVDHNDILSLKGIGKFKKLKQLSVAQNSISNVDPLNDLENLEHLRIEGNPIQQTSPLIKLNLLRFLSIRSLSLDERSCFKREMPECNVFEVEFK